MSAPTRVLLLGGTGDAASLAERLRDAPALRLISSLAGRVAKPVYPPGEVRVGGFGGAEGLAAYLWRERIELVIDATHPFAARMSAHAVQACTRCDVPLVALVRPQWQAQRGDRWFEVDDVARAAALAPRLGARIFVTTGRQELAPFAERGEGWYLIRAIDAPQQPLPARHVLLLERGPFCVDGERELLRAHAIDVVVSKNSGGPATYAKIEAARELGLPVVMIRRPPVAAAETVDSVAAALAWLRARTASVPVG